MTTQQEINEATEQEILIAGNVAIIEEELRRMFFVKLPQVDSLISELSRPHLGLYIPFEPKWFDKQFIPPNAKGEVSSKAYKIRNASMYAAEKAFAQWFKEMFGLDVSVSIVCCDDNAGDYTGAFEVRITLNRTKRKRRFLGFMS